MTSRAVARAHALSSPTVRGVAAIGVLLVLADVVFMLRDHSAPAWDQSFYLANAWSEVLAHHQGFTQMIHAIMHTDPSHGPLFELLTAFFMGLFGPHAVAGLLVNVVALPVLVVAVAGIADRVGGRRSVIWSVALLFTMPLIVGLFREVLEDFLLTSLCAMALLASIRCNRFHSLAWSVILALAFAAAILTKVTAPLQIGLALVVGVMLGMSPATSRRPGARQLRNFAAASVLFLALTLGWYGPHFSATVAYVKSATSGPLALGTSAASLLAYFGELFFFSFGLAVVLVAVIGFAAGFRSAARPFAATSGSSRQDLALRVALPLAWLLPAVLTQATSANQDQRLIAPALCAVSVLAGWAIARTRSRWPRALAGVLIAALGLLPLLIHTVGPNGNKIWSSLWASRLESGDLVAELPKALIAMEFGNAPIGYESSPQPVNYASPFVSWLLTERQRHAIAGPVVVGILSTDPVLNGNTLRWLDIRTGNGTRILTEQPTLVGMTRAQIQSEFSGYDAVITFSNSATNSGVKRAILLNDQLVTTDKARPYLKAFRGPSASYRLPIGSAEVRWRS